MSIRYSNDQNNHNPNHNRKAYGSQNPHSKQGVNNGYVVSGPPQNIQQQHYNTIQPSPAMHPQQYHAPQQHYVMPPQPRLQPQAQVQPYQAGRFQRRMKGAPNGQLVQAGKVPQRQFPNNAQLMPTALQHTYYQQMHPNTQGPQRIPQGTSHQQRVPQQPIMTQAYQQPMLMPHHNIQAQQPQMQQPQMQPAQPTQPTQQHDGLQTFSEPPSSTQVPDSQVSQQQDYVQPQMQHTHDTLPPQRDVIGDAANLHMPPPIGTTDTPEHARPKFGDSKGTVQLDAKGKVVKLETPVEVTQQPVYGTDQNATRETRNVAGKLPFGHAKVQA